MKPENRGKTKEKSLKTKKKKKKTFDYPHSLEIQALQFFLGPGGGAVVQKDVEPHHGST